MRDYENATGWQALNTIGACTWRLEQNGEFIFKEARQEE